jgi:hypothetical protein
VSGIAITLRALHHGETTLAHDLTSAAQRHEAEHEFHHVALDLSTWSARHSALIEATSKRCGLDLAGITGTGTGPGLLAEVRERTAADRSPEPGILLLRDLCDLHLHATENSLYWEMLGQVAQATKDGELLSTVSDCHPQTLRQMRWTNTMIKNLCPQLLTAL